MAGFMDFPGDLIVYVNGRAKILRAATFANTAYTHSASRVKVASVVRHW